jgi:hypothetical protein
MNAVHGTVQRLARTSASLQHDLDRASAERATAETAREQLAEATRIESEDPTAPDREAAGLASRCDTTISGESVDADWSRVKSDQFGAFFARPALAGTKVKTVDCRTTMCRVELVLRSNADRTRLLQDFSDLAGPTGMAFAHIETANDLEIAVYVTRDGVGLP